MCHIFVVADMMRTFLGTTGDTWAGGDGDGTKGTVDGTPAWGPIKSSGASEYRMPSSAELHIWPKLSRAL